MEPEDSLSLKELLANAIQFQWIGFMNNYEKVRELFEKSCDDPPRFKKS
jgi:hypothetical protein